MTYLDAASAAPWHPVARQALLAALDDGWADPDRLHAEGRRAGRLLEAARETVAGVLGVPAPEVSFTPSGTQAATLAVLGAARARRRVGDRVVHSAVEHSSVLAAVDAHRAAGGSAAEVGVDAHGRADVAVATELLSAPGTALVTLQSANHEVGTRQPVEQVAAAARSAGVPLHTDATWTLGREPVPPGWSLLSAAAGPWGGGPGVGLLVVRAGTRWVSPLPPDGRERGRVPGVPDVPGVVAAAAGLHASAAEAAEVDARLRPLVDRLRHEVPRRVTDAVVLGDPVDRLPHVLTVSFLFVDGETLLRELAGEGFSVSSGSSCTSDAREPSHVLLAMGALSQGNVRVSLHRGTGEEDVERFLASLVRAVPRVRAQAGVGDL